MFLLLLDPAGFAHPADYQREMSHLIALIEASPPDDPSRPVRVPGRRAWRERQARLNLGVPLDPDVLPGLAAHAAACGLTPPSPVDASSARS